jgi:hypothetical protein
VTLAVETIVNIGLVADDCGGLDASDASLAEAMAEALEAVRTAADEACRLIPELGAGPAGVRLWTTLATGLDRRAAQTALDRRMRLAVVLGATRAEHVLQQGAGARGMHEALLERAESVLELCSSGEAPAAKLLLGQVDMLVVATPGGIGDARPGAVLIANAAVQSNMPLLLLGADRSRAHEVVWRGWRPHPHPAGDVFDAPRRAGVGALADAVRGLLQAPPGAGRLREFLHEPLDASVRRPEYALFVRLVGPAPTPVEPDAPEPDRDARDVPDPAGDVLAAFEERAERLGAAHGGSYRSQFVTRFAMLALLSVGLNVLYVARPQAQAAFAGIQAGIIGLILLDGHIARRMRWHERWLEYRYLRERLRTLRFLRRVGAPLPVLGSSAAAPRNNWMDWFGLRLAGMVGVESERFDRACVRRLAAALDRGELDGQLAYHDRASLVLRTIARRLGKSARALLWVALALGAARVLVEVLGLPVADAMMVVLSTAPFLLPPVALALEGIASRGDFERLVQRSESTRAALAAIRKELRRPELDFERLHGLSWHLAAIMAADVAEWRFVFEARQ